MSSGVKESNKIMKNLPEPWMRGTINDLNPALAQVLYSFQQAREDIAAFTEGLTAAQMWTKPEGLAPVGFHVRHIAGSVDRLLAYALGRALTAPELEALEREKDPGASREELLLQMDRSFDAAEQKIRLIDPGTFNEPRAVGRKRLPTTLIGLLIHIAEHTQRHVGQAIVTAKLVRATAPCA